MIQAGNSAATTASTTAALPFIVIEAKKGWFQIGLRELWQFRELLYFLVWRDVKVRYKQTVLGVAWVILQPLMSMVVFTLFFGKLAKIPSDGFPYPIFSYCALLPWGYFANALDGAGNSLVGNANLIRKVYFPRLIIPAAAALAGTLDFAIAFTLFLPMMGYYRIFPGVGLLLLPVLLFSTLMLAMGVGLWLSALNVEYRDVRYAIPFLIQLWMFTTPIVYPLSLVPERYRFLMALNPMAGIIDGYRSCLLDRPMAWPALLCSILIGFATLVTGCIYFSRVQRRFADVI
ncbi:MAG: ABC transporter permease [Acidobacteria bacterium]|nr:ABC transporter permease [Acidobacteriota bacterium]MBI3655112.1 ABC transporter permease [Acidobacteriota bacterium]